MRSRERVVVLFVQLLLCAACGAANDSSRRVASWDLTPSDHKTVMELVRKVYDAGLEGRIVAWYETTSRGYFDPIGRGRVDFEAPISTLSVAIPEHIAMTGDIRSKLDRLASTTSHDGWRLVEHRVAIEPGGGGPSGRFSKVTLYPIRVEAPHPVSKSTASRNQRTSEPVGSGGGKPKSSACEILARNIRETGSTYAGMEKTLREVDGNDLIGCEM